LLKFVKNTYKYTVSMFRDLKELGVVVEWLENFLSKKWFIFKKLLFILVSLGYIGSDKCDSYNYAV